MLRNFLDLLRGIERARGRRDALLEAAALAEQHADIAAELAPEGRLGFGLCRASIAHDIAVELRSRAEVLR